MKYAIISDIHGNMPALQEVLNDAKQLCVDAYIFAGDYIGDLPYPNEVVSTIRNLKNAYSIAGNKEDYLRNLVREDQANWIHDQFAMIYWNFKELTPDNLEYLINLPDVETIEVGAYQKILVAHASSQFFSGTKLQNLSSSKYREKFERKQFTHNEYLEYSSELLSGDSNLMEKISTISEDLILFGHSHVQWYAQLGGKTVINPGSCGLPLDFNADVAYTIAEFTDGQWEVVDRRVPYDIEDTINYTKNTSLYQNAKVWCNVAFEEMRTGKDEITFFFMHVHEVANGQTSQTFPYSNEIWSLAAKMWFEKSRYLFK